MRTLALRIGIVPLDARRSNVTFRGLPLAKAKVTVYAPNAWLQERRPTNAAK